MPTTTNRKFSIPATGTEVGVWGSNDLNPNFSTLDGILGSVVTLNLAGSGPVTLTDAQQQVAVIRLTGILTSNVQVTVTEPAFWIIDNRTSGNFIVTLTGGAGQVISTPQGSRYQVAFDGTDVLFVNLGEPATFKRFCVPSVPAWMTACTVNPWLPCRGGTALIATYPALAALISTTFGGNGITTFGLPDLQGRTEFDLDNGAGRLTSATMTPDGNTIGAVGGAQTEAIARANLPAVNWNVNDPGHLHSTVFQQILGLGGGGGNTAVNFPGSAVTANTSTATTNITVSSGGSGTPLTTMPPAMVTGITFIKT